MTITAIAVLIFSADHLYKIDVKTILAILSIYIVAINVIKTDGIRNKIYHLQQC